MNASINEAERVGRAFSEDGMLAARQFTRTAIQQIADAMRPGMLEEDAVEHAKSVLANLGLRATWHPVRVRFGINTIKAMKADRSFVLAVATGTSTLAGVFLRARRYCSIKAQISRKADTVSRRRRPHITHLFFTTARKPLMPRLHTVEMSEATGRAAELFSAVKATVGKVPNSYIGIGANSPVALEAVLNLEASLKKSTLSALDIEVVKLVVSETTGCDYCLAAHTLLTKKLGLDREAVLALRKGRPSGDARNDALARFVLHLLTTIGTVQADVVTEVKQAGVTDAQIVDVTMAVASITFTNLFNRVNDTTLDFPAAD